MSYLDLPRLHFGGLFYTGPNTINNITQNYSPKAPLENPQGKYLPVAGWNAGGVSQLWLEECTVLSAVNAHGKILDSAAADPLIGALVETSTGSKAMGPDPQHPYDVAKMVDLDPDQQGRSEVYGVHLFVTLPNGAGFYAELSVPNLRQLNPRVIGARSSWGFVGNWMGALQSVVWHGDISGSALLTALRAASAQGISAKFTVDLHQNDPSTIKTAGDMFCYGRIQGSLGPQLAGELAQVAPGRCLQQPTAQQAAINAALAAHPQPPQRLPARESVRLKTETIHALQTAAATPKPDPWNPAAGLVRTNAGNSVLHIDLGGSIVLQSSTTAGKLTSNGKCKISDGISLGVFANGSFHPFAQGSVSFTPQYVQHTSKLKNCFLFRNSGVFSVPLTAAEATLAAANPLTVQAASTILLEEPDNGIWMDVSVSNERLELNGSAQVQLMARTFGQAIANAKPAVTASVLLVAWTKSGGTWNSDLVPSTDLAVTIGNTDANGIATIAIKPTVKQLPIPGIREPLDSQVYYVMLSDTQGNVIGDGQSTVSVLLFAPFTAPAKPGWNDVSAVFTAYARLYPGMKAILNIADRQTVKNSHAGIASRMSLPMSDPAYMPVTRDLAPSKMKMIVDWLTSNG